MKFSLLMSIYYKEEAEYFDRCMRSIWEEQTHKPSEIILVEDGKLTVDLYIMIEEWKKKLGDIFKNISIEKNVGLGDALNLGLQYCTYDLVARMDTDDIALDNRFEKQLEVFNDDNIDVCSSWVSEFDDNEDEIVSYRRLPEMHEEIVKFAKKRNPINHPAVMYKKSFVQKAGGYKKMMWFEDYYLWVRMIRVNAIFYNIPEPLVSMRAGYGQLERRSGIRYAMSEIALQKLFLKLEFISRYEFIRNISIRFIIRVIPKSLVKIIYKLLRA